MDEVDALDLKFTVRLQHTARGAAESAAKHSLHVVDKYQSLPIMSTAHNDVEHIWLPYPGHHEGTLIE